MLWLLSESHGCTAHPTSVPDFWWAVLTNGLGYSVNLTDALPTLHLFLSENHQEFPPITDPSPALPLLVGVSGGFRLAITDYPFPITHYPLPITDYPLPITYLQSKKPTPVSISTSPDSRLPIPDSRLLQQV
ncbi:hypothetical protein [Moorena sp. SIO4G3]|uniref:hypothetical protein n=1 Tax=Moorena sp. SIO4G3 TaxID=2607821 RepID=UPI001428E960|nr:hypothetical protein [Moorena sp. SIO4G3]NEO81223.1 hypothetical protein [Moorena sp. SIO4G3]